MKTLIYLLIFSFSISAFCFFSYKGFHDWSKKRHVVPARVVYDFQKGTKLDDLSAALRENDVVSSELLFKYWVRFFAQYGRFQAGKYLFEGQIAPREIITNFVNGSVYNPIVYELTIPEGDTYKAVTTKLVAAGISTPEEMKALSINAEFLKSLKVPALEGYLYPATYSFSEMPDAKKVISIAVNEFWKRLPQDYEQRIAALGLTLDQAVVFASLIELETPNLDEKPLVSEVIWRRLRDKAALGIDATLIYGIPDYNGNLTRKHLDDASNPYNTRIHPGLPPTAIGSPDLSSLLAVLNPSNEGYYFYVVDPNLGNRHHFSKTISEHNTYVRALILHSKKMVNNNE